MTDFSENLNDLADCYPQWTEEFHVLQIRESYAVRPAGNDGLAVYVHPRLMQYLTKEGRSFYIAQQFLHLKLKHAARGEGKNPRIWKKASDAVVNAMLKEDGFVLPEDAVLFPDASESSAEHLYDFLLKTQEESEEETESEELLELPVPDEKNHLAGKETDARSRNVAIPGLAALVDGLAEMLEPSMQTDYDWFPGSTIRDGVLRHEFRAYPVAYSEVLLDTSASVDEELLRAFVRGVKGLLRQDAVLRVGCFDTRFYGFQEVRTEQDILNLELVGSGGTDFHTAINAFTGDAENKIIFTDGYAEMPEQRCDAIWVVYGKMNIQPQGGRVLYGKIPAEKEKHEIDFLIT